MADRLPEYIVRDLRQKAGDDAVDAMRRTIALADHFDDKTAIALWTAAMVSAFGVGAQYLKTPSDADPQSVVDLFFENIRPMMVAAMLQFKESGNAARS